MVTQASITVALILGGAALMSLALVSTIRLYMALGPGPHTRRWRVLLALQLGLLPGYLGACGLVIDRHTDPLLPIGGLLLAGCALAVFLVVRLSHAAIRSSQSALATAEATSDAHGLLLANMGIELRTPLVEIIGYSALLLAGTSPAAELRQINEAGQRLLGRIDSLLDLAELEANRLDLHQSPVSVSALVTDLEATIRPLADQNLNSLRFESATKLPALVTDEQRLRQILLTLLTNACEFTHDGQVTLRVAKDNGRKLQEVDRGGAPFTLQSSTFVLFEVCDTGVGMSTEQLEQVFLPPVQATGHTVRRHTGRGLGLTVARRLARLMGGDITVISTPGKGSTFTLWLPTPPL